MMTRPCRRCGDRPAHKSGECSACYDYRRRTGQHRPLTLIVRARLRREEDRLHRLAWPANA